jgi:hypothetical protein
MTLAMFIHKSNEVKGVIAVLAPCAAGVAPSRARCTTSWGAAWQDETFPRVPEDGWSFPTVAQSSHKSL